MADADVADRPRSFAEHRHALPHLLGLVELDVPSQGRQHQRAVPRAIRDGSIDPISISADGWATPIIIIGTRL